jgi:hypothetical protein
VLLLVMLIRTYSPSNSHAFSYVFNVSTTPDTHNNISRHSTSYSPKPSICFPSVSPLTLHINSTFPSNQHSQLNSLAVFPVICFKTPEAFVLFPNPKIDLFCLSVTRHINYLYTYQPKIKTQHTFRNVSPVVTVTVSTQFVPIST